MLKIVYKSFLLFFFTLIQLFGYSQSDTSIAITSSDTSNFDIEINDSIDAYIPLTEQGWVDSIYSTLNTDEKIAQLIMIRAHSNKSKAYHEKIANTIRNQKVGGLCFFQGGVGRQINLVNYYQEISKTPLMIAIDGEWGVSMRLDSVMRFPRQMTLGAIQNDSLIYEMGIEIAKQCKAVGVDMNFAPVADVNNNAANPVINSRSFGENPQNVALKTSAYMRGLQSQFVLACAKHFPGHCDTDSDSHKTLPTVNANKHDIDSIHLFPFKQLIDDSVASIMIAHLFIPALDSTKDLATTLSTKVVRDLLKTKMNFQGLAITDALEMKGVSNYFKPGQLEVLALLAGNDILLMPHDAQTSIDSIRTAIENGILDSTDIFNRVKKVLKYKYQAKLNNKKKLNTAEAYKTINSSKAEALNNQLYRNAITLITNTDSILPLTTNNKKRVAVITVGLASRNTFSKEIELYRAVTKFSIKRNASTAEVSNMAKRLQGFDYVVMAVLNTNNSPSKNYGIYQSTYDLANLIAQHTNLIIDMHANPYAASRFLETSDNKALLISYQEDKAAQRMAAEAIFGGFDIRGKLPVSINDTIKQGFGLELKKKRLSFVIPEELGINSDSLLVIDSIIQSGIDAEAYPGCQVLIAKDGKVFYKKNFGSQTYKNKYPITDSSIYDLASITKVMATTLAVMQLADEGKIDVDRRLKYYFPELDSTNKGDILIRDLLSHQARLTAWIPFYLHTIKKGKLNSTLYRTTKQEGYSTQVCKNMFILDSYADSIMLEIKESKPRKRKKYKYSDLGMYYMRRMIEQQSEMPVQEYLNQTIYNPLGLQHIGYKPLERFPLKQIVPTENDTYFRHKKIQGYVHDPGCAMMGGIEGHAGLFSNSLDLAIISQMFMQGGEYGGERYLNTDILEDFTRQQFPLNHNRRGLGFDKPIPNHEEGGPTCPLVSSKSFGHSGFTGTYFWVDPENKITYIFLSNRTYPSAENRKLITMNIRTRIQEEIYNVLEEEE
jgi:beta-glucosidase-like glycosyl hydrolase/CubicO group peptidase (beta-lactamase class C family)